MHDENGSKLAMNLVDNRNNGASTSKKSLKLSPSQHHFTNSSNIVAVMMDEKLHETEDHSFYMPPPLRRDLENGHHSMDYEEGMINADFDSFYHFR